ncbi:DUF378 domain-containing protein [Gracilibacillus suaedae]|uniref:DUF378 domain-containing protein n=1 Tax=Gracilibacillus suaedae TaxID=2820273 RepID=UPI0038B37B1A
MLSISNYWWYKLGLASIFGGQDAALSRLIYTLVGIGALCCLPLSFADESKRDIEGSQNLAYSTEFAEENELSEFNNKFYWEILLKTPLFFF